jgi:hypothetical protein
MQSVQFLGHIRDDLALGLDVVGGSNDNTEDLSLAWHAGSK